MIGPINKILDETFLNLVIDSINIYLSNVQPIPTQQQTVDKYNWSIYSNDNLMYKKYIDTEPKLMYNNEEFYIRNIQILDQNIDTHPKNRTYKDIFNTYNSDLIPRYCNCEDDDDTDDNDNIQEKINLLPLEIVKQAKLNGEYSSYPSSINNINGWTMIFQYKENNFNLILILGPKRYIKYKAIIGHGDSSHKQTIKNPRYNWLQPIYTIDDNKLVYNYMPNDLFFDEDFIQIIKNGLLSNSNIINYKNIEYKIIDSIFYKHSSTMFSCGCYYSNSTILSLHEGINLMPNHVSYGYEFSYSCTPEWYLQVQFGNFQSHSNMSAKFILDYNKT